MMNNVNELEIDEKTWKTTPRNSNYIIPLFSTLRGSLLSGTVPRFSFCVTLYDLELAPLWTGEQRRRRRRRRERRG
jgi:hypothetical protein